MGKQGTGQRRLLVFWLCSASLWLGLMSLYPWQVDSDDARTSPWPSSDSVCWSSVLTSRGTRGWWQGMVVSPDARS